MKSKELFDIEQSTVEPNTAKSYIYRRNSSNKVKNIDQKLNNYTRVSERSQIKSNPYITEGPKYTTSMSKVKRKGIKTKGNVANLERSSEIIKNFFNTTAAPHQFKSGTESSGMKHKRFKTQINITSADIGSSIISICAKNGIKKPNKRCSSTDGTTSQSQVMKRKLNSISKASKQTVIKNKNRKYFKAAKDIGSILSMPQDTRNPQNDYVEQINHKQRYTAFECNINEGSKSQERNNESNNSGKISSFSVSYYHGK